MELRIENYGAPARAQRQPGAPPVYHISVGGDVPIAPRAGEADSPYQGESASLFKGGFPCVGRDDLGAPWPLRLPSRQAPRKTHHVGRGILDAPPCRGGPVCPPVSLRNDPSAGPTHRSAPTALDGDIPAWWEAGI